MISLINEVFGIDEIIKTGEAYQIPDSDFEKEKAKAYNFQNNNITTGNKLLRSDQETTHFPLFNTSATIIPISTQNNLLKTIFNKI